MAGEWQSAFVSKRGSGKGGAGKERADKPCPHGKYVDLRTCRKTHTKYDHAASGLMGTKGAKAQPTKITGVVSGGAPGTGKKRGRR
nr:hypothetical protein [Actinomycetota bacterium]